MIQTQVLSAQHYTVLTKPTDTSDIGANHRIVISYYTPASEQNLNEFEKLISSYLNLYIENCAELVNGDVVMKKSRKQTMRELNNIVTNALKFYDYQPLKHFKTFSSNVSKKIDAIDELNFSKTNFSAGASDSESAARMEQFYFQREIDNLKELVRMEVGIYARANVLVKSSTEETFIDAATKQKLIDQYTSGDNNTLLRPIRIELSDASVAMLNMEDNSTLQTSGANGNINSESLSTQMLRLLESNNAKLDGMQKQIDDLRSEQLKLWQQTQDEKNLALQSQIDDLREMVMALVGLKTGEPTASLTGISLPTGINKAVIKNVPSGISVMFAKGSAVLDANSRLMLNEVVDILAREPQMNIIITGYADRTGDTARNLVLSQQRANAVKQFIAQSGLSASRLITEFYGDKNSKSDNAADRKVTIEFVMQQ